MNSVIITKNYEEPQICEKEILRYAGCKNSDEELLQLLRACIEEVRDKLSYKVCYRELPVNIKDDVCDFDSFTLKSRNLAHNLQGCKKTVVFSATLGVEIDRLIAKNGRISPSRALMLQAIGAERIEALCDTFCEDIKKEQNAELKPRFSPGYGDLPLETQKSLFGVLDCAKQIGLSLNDSLLMSPSKSVTAFVGLVEPTANSAGFEDITTGASPEPTLASTGKCDGCNKTDCEYRGV